MTDSIIYNSDKKITKKVITNIDSNTYSGDSLVYVYSNGHLKSSTQYDKEGKIWTYCEYETDKSGRVVKSIDNSDSSYELYRYSSALIHSHKREHTNVNMFYALSSSKNSIKVSFHKGTILKSMDFYDLKGNRISATSEINNSSGILNIGGISSKFYVLMMKTSGGSVSEKISF